MTQVANGVADAALRWFAASSECKRKIPASHWTVFAAVVVASSVHEPTASGDVEHMPKFRVLAAATGTKCLGQRDLHIGGLVVNDCHAEVLARRALVRYLYTEALSWASGHEDSAVSLFARDRATQRLTLKPQHTLHLYISEAPCGDAAIYELQADTVDELVKQRIERVAPVAQPTTTADDANASHDRSAFRLTGAKAKRKRDDDNIDFGPSASKQRENTSNSVAASAVHPQANASAERRFDQRVGIARVKSGRSDLPLDKQTHSMSCSDKLAKWVALGVQGSLLLQFYERVALTSIVVAFDPTSASIETQRIALQRAVVDRIATTQQRTCELYVVAQDAAFVRARTATRVASPLALNWTHCEPHWRHDALDTTRRASMTASYRNAQQQLHSFFASAADVEVLSGATGLKHGAKKLAKMKDDNETLRVASRLTKRLFFLAFHAVVAATSDTRDSVRSDNATESLSYAQLKQAVPTVTTPDDRAAAVFAARATIERTQRSQFFIAIGQWVGVPPTYKQFSLE